MKEIYFDNSATTNVDKEVAEVVYEAMLNNYGNPSSHHHKGLTAEKLLTEARRDIAKTLGVEETNIIFTAGGTESDNMAITGIANAYKKIGNHIITTAVEHPAVLKTVKALSENGFKVTVLPVDRSGKINLDDLASAIKPETILVSVMAVNNETGTIEPLADIGRLLNAQKQRIFFHVDAVQAYGKIPIALQSCNIDLLSASGHKIHAPKGVGFLYIAKGVRIVPLVHGGGQENNLRSGTENVPGILGFAKAAKAAYNECNNRYNQVEMVKKTFLVELGAKVSGWHINSPKDALPYVLNIRFNGIKSEVLLHALETKGLYVSSGSACAARKDSLSHVLTALGLSREEIEGSIRFSFSYHNTAEEAVEAACIVVDTVNELRKILSD
ncbi:MAG: cysteine desulfurase family protein [Clostridia bacterium]|jgi:cysteine desulfurase|nr:cysteine desulfurase family protein [Clostridia bacterium]MDD4571889.1 cysteine desulfurase family protein [Clostridia bacterium]